MREAIISFPMLGEGFAINPPYRIPIGSFDIYFYGLVIAFGFLLAIWYASKTCDRLDIKMDDVYDYVIWGVLFGVIGARLYYCITYTDDAGVHTYLQNPASFLAIRDGGLAIYGGVIGAIAALCVRARMRKESVFPALDVMAFGFLIGQTAGRWGNFFNREAFGYETDIFCRMGLTLNGQTIYVHPTFLYESLWNLAGFLLLHFHCKKHRRYQGQYFLAYLIWYGVGRALIESLRSDSLWLIPGVIRISQLLAAVTALAALAVWLCNAHRLNAGKAPLLGRLPRAADTGDHSCADETAQPCAAAPADSDTTIKHSSAAGPSAGQEE